VSRFRDGVARLAARTERELQALYGRYEAGLLSKEQFVALAAALLTRARIQGVGLADLALTAEAIMQLREPTAPLGLTVPDGDNGRLQRSVGSVLTVEVQAEGDDFRRSIKDRLLRLARDSAAEAAVWAYGVGMQQRGAKGWVRVTDRDPCKVCQNLADGVVRSPSVVMKRHTGDMCVQSAVF
jgi:hypothetical protein